MDAMEYAMKNHEQTTVEIDLSDSILYPETNIAPDELRALNSILEKLANRNFKMGVPGALYGGYVYKSDVTTRITGELPRLNIYVQF